MNYFAHIFAQSKQSLYFCGEYGVWCQNRVQADMKEVNCERFLRMLQPARFRKSRVDVHPTDGRTAFDSDYARVAMSASIRRLQDKTQVFPLAEYDFVRNRLTHSLEVMTLAKGMGLGVEKMLLEQGVDLVGHDINHPLRNAVSKILETAALIHDVGNPPFGHKAEKAVQKYFRNSNGYVGRQVFSDILTDAQRADLQNIEGNVQGLRQLMHLGLADDEYSFNLTMPVLATLVKYPFSSLDGNRKDDPDPLKHKFGFLQSEKERYEQIRSVLGLQGGQRHPLTYLLEAADDIAYNVCDLEDGFRNGIISIGAIKQNLSEQVTHDRRISDVVSRLSDDNDALTNEWLIQKLRITTQSQMIIASTSRFVERIDDIVEGKLTGTLLDNTDYALLCEKLRELDVYNFRSDAVSVKEKEGIEKMRYLLDGYAQAMVLLAEDTDPLAPERQLYETISPNYRKAACEKGKSVPTGLYGKLLLVTDYIFGMTDGYVLHLYDDKRIMELILRVKCRLDAI